jgi:diguanylate cyclase (GGDEF)-like protein/PAS domain S-box-containing protein
MDGNELVWLANGLLLAYLLLAPRWRWPSLLFTGFLALETVSFCFRYPWKMDLLSNALNIFETLIAALLMRRRSAELPRFSDLRYLLRFICLAAIIAPVASASVLVMTRWTHLVSPYTFLHWVGADSLGIALITPTFVALFRSNFKDRQQWRKIWILVLLTVVVAAVSFSQSYFALAFLIYPLLVLIALRADLGWAALSLLLITIVGSWYTIRAQGLFASIQPVISIDATVLLQLYLAVGMVMLYSVSVVMERQKEIERRLQEIVSLHQLVTENSRDAIILSDFDGHRSYVSSAVERMTGWKPDEIKAFNSFDLLHPDEREEIVAMLQAMRSGTEGDRIELRNLKRDGSYCWVESSLRTIRDPRTGVPTGILNITRDISERKDAEQRLHEIASLHRLVTENSRDVIILADLDGRRTYVSAASERMGGWTPEELMVQQGVALVHPDDRRIVVNALRQITGGGDDGMIEVRARKRNGEYIWVEASLRLIRDPATGAATGILNVTRDISERKLIEQSREFHYTLAHAIQDVSLDGILVVNQNGDLVACNKRFSEIWKIPAPVVLNLPHLGDKGYPDEEILDRIATQVIAPEPFVKRARELYADPEASDQCQIELKDGRMLERYTTSLRGEAGQYLGRAWFFSDITERKRAEQQLQEAYRAVEALAITDALTGLANRRRFDQCIASEWRRGVREQKPLSFLLLDVDLFKTYNDAYGHLRGDDCLKQIAESAQNVVARPGDLVARFGGEEFAVILPNTGNDGAVQMAGEICSALRARKLPHRNNPTGFMTVSVGCATMVPGAAQSAVALIELADEALYKAKRDGRNQVCNGNTMSRSREDAAEGEDE